MFVRWVHYFTSLAIVVGLSVVYQNLLTPWMQPPQIEPVPLKPSAVMRLNDSMADLFAEGTWQRGSCRQLQTSEATLLFEKWEQTADDQWKLWPITVVIGRGLSGIQDRDPILIDAPEGAEIKFAESLDVMSGGAPPIERGLMMGQVRIYRNGQDGDQSRKLDVRTANVGIDSRKIYTTEDISMTVGRARLVGADLTLHLAKSATVGGNSAPVLDRMELIYLDELTMPTGGSGPAAQGLLSGGSAASEGDSTPPAVISIACGGRVEYDFAIDQLYLRDSVSLSHQVAGQLADRFDCETMELTLNDPSNDLIERTSPLDWLLKVKAHGGPAIAKLPSMDLEIAADNILFNARQGLVQASGDGRRGIRVRRGGVTAKLSQLFYQFDPKYPETIGVIDARGAGIVTVDDPGIPIRRAQWVDGFRLRPVGVATADDMNVDVEMWIDGDIHAWLVDGGEFEAQSIFGLLSPEPVPDEPSKKTLGPKWFEITGQVSIDTTAIAAQTEQLLLNFVSEETPPSRSSQSQSSQSQSQSSQSQSATLGGGDPAEKPSALRQWVVQPTGSQPGLVDPVARAKPIIRGDSINAQLRRNSAGLSAKKLSVVGNVQVEHTLETGGQSLPAKLTGQQLQLIDGGGQDVLELKSGPESPARFELGDGYFVGPMIQIRPSDNMVWINAAGEFQIPTAALPQGLAGQVGGNVTWTKPPHCRWLGEMIFDGRRAVLSGGVDINAALVNGREPWELKLSGDRLEVDLLEAVQMRDVSQMRTATIQKISMIESEDRPVIAQATQRAPDGVQEAKHLIYARSLIMTPGGGGVLVGQGPGWYRGWSIAGADGLVSRDDRPEAVSNATMIDSAERSLAGIHLTFNDSMRADLTGRNLDFLRGVRVGVREVMRWDETFDAGKMDAISMGQSTLDCDRLRFTVEPRDPGLPAPAAGETTAWEMEATSGVVFRTRNEHGLLEGTASRAAYSSSKDLFTADGAPNRPAIVRQTGVGGQAGHEGTFRTISIRPRTMTIDNLVPESLKIAVPPGTGGR